MLKVLLKKQLMEVFRSYFYNAKKNRKRSKAGVILLFVFFALIMVGVLGGIFTLLSVTLCEGLVDAGVGWLFFMLMGSISILLGAFGSIFNTYAGLYLSKDNDLLLSMPVPVSYIAASRLLNVYLLGLMYSAVVLMPAEIVYWIRVKVSVPIVICGILLLLIVSFIVLILSCLLGWAVAKISLKLKHKSFVTVILSLAFIGGYYFFYFKAQGMVTKLIQNAALYGGKIRGTAYVLYLFGRIGEGAVGPAMAFFAVTALLLALTWYILLRSFLSIATNSGKTEKIKYRERAVREKSPAGALLVKELNRFTASPAYMLNCGLGILLIPALGVFLLIKGSAFMPLLEQLFTDRMDFLYVLLCACLIMLAAMNDMAAPSVSLEGKNIWILQSMPVRPGQVLYAKALLQILLTGIPLLFTVICVLCTVSMPMPVRVLLVLVSMSYVVFWAVFAVFLNIKLPNLNWTNETVPIKQGGSIIIALFGGWGIAFALGGLYFLVGDRIGAVPYLAIWAAVFTVLIALICSWLNTRGSRAFMELQ